MIAFILKRLAIAIPTLLVLIVFSFILMKIAPGSPFTGEKNLPPETLKNIFARYNLDKPQWQHSQDYWNEKDVIPLIDLDGPEFVYN